MKMFQNSMNIISEVTEQSSSKKNKEESSFKTDSDFD